MQYVPARKVVMTQSLCSHDPWWVNITSCLSLDLMTSATARNAFATIVRAEHIFMGFLFETSINPLLVYPRLQVEKTNSVVFPSIVWRPHYGNRNTLNSCALPPCSNSPSCHHFTAYLYPLILSIRTLAFLSDFLPVNISRQTAGKWEC